MERTAIFSLASTLIRGGERNDFSADFGKATNDLSIQEFLARPVYVGSYSWTVSSTDTVPTTIHDLLENWVDSSEVNPKLRGYKFWRGKPRLRVVVNGNPFSYGKIVFAVQPMMSYDSLGYSPASIVGLVDKAQAFSLPHVSVDPGISATYDLELPWITGLGWFNMFGRSRNHELRLSACVVNALASATADAAPAVTIRFYVIMEDVELAVPSVAAILGDGPKKQHAGERVAKMVTSVNKELTTGGPLSGPLSALSGVAGSLTDVPVIGAYATPIAGLLGKAGDFARWMGYSRPPVVDEGFETLTKTSNSYALMDGPDNLHRLVGDPKQSVSFTAEAASCGSDDDMLISSIIRKHGYLATLTWATDGSLVGSFPVTPSEPVSETATTLQHTPLGYVSSAFRYWTGSISYRFEVVASAFHRGSFQIIWVPYDDPPGGSPLDYVNMFQSQVVDLSGPRTVDFVVPYGADAPISLMTDLNGVVRVNEIVPITSNGSTSPIYINVYVSAGDDFQLYRPGFENTGLWTPLPPGSEVIGGTPTVVEILGDRSTEANNETDGVGSSTSNLVVPLSITRNLVYFGESFSSVKQLAMRTNLALNLSNTWGAGILHGLILPTFEYYLPAGEAVPTTHYVFPTFASWFEPMFAASRGGQRFRISIRTGNGDLDAQLFAKVYVASAPGFNWGGASSPASFAYGGANECLTAHPTIDIEFPHVERFRFRNAQWLQRIAASETAERLAVYTSRTSTLTSDAATTYVFRSAADDYSLHYFMFVPRLYKVGAWA